MKPTMDRVNRLLAASEQDGLRLVEVGVDNAQVDAVCQVLRSVGYQVVVSSAGGGKSWLRMTW